MNIHQFMDKRPELRELSEQAIYEMLLKRQEAFRGFASIEKSRGFIQPMASVNTSDGQEILRLLMFRVIEECTESYAAIEPAHIKEEAIDAINYLWAIPVLDPSHWRLNEVAKSLHQLFLSPAQTTRLTWPPVTSMLTFYDIANVSIWLAGDVGDVLRNRSWMQNPQDVFFAGKSGLDLSIMRVTYTLFRLFENWDEFSRYYDAKHEVLMFRLRSKY